MAHDGQLAPLNYSSWKEVLQEEKMKMFQVIKVFVNFIKDKNNSQKFECWIFGCYFCVVLYQIILVHFCFSYLLLEWSFEMCWSAWYILWTQILQGWAFRRIVCLTWFRASFNGRSNLNLTTFLFPTLLSPKEAICGLFMCRPVCVWVSSHVGIGWHVREVVGVDIHREPKSCKLEPLGKLVA